MKIAYKKHQQSGDLYLAEAGGCPAWCPLRKEPLCLQLGADAQETRALFP